MKDHVNVINGNASMFIEEQALLYLCFEWNHDHAHSRRDTSRRAADEANRGNAWKAATAIASDVSLDRSPDTLRATSYRHGFGAACRA